MLAAYLLLASPAAFAPPGPSFTQAEIRPTNTLVRQATQPGDLTSWARRQARLISQLTETNPGRTSASTYAFLTRIAVPAEDLPSLVPGVGGVALLVRLWVPETQMFELFGVHVPSSPPGVVRPMLTCFHGANSSHLDIYFRTSYFAEASARDWFLIAPLYFGGVGAWDFSYGSASSQEHVKAVVDYMLAAYPIDRDRMYGVGFSMGGGAVLSYAARNRDRMDGALAAVVNHTGTLELTDTYVNMEPMLQPKMEIAMGGTPTDNPFAYQRSSTIVFDSTGALDPFGPHMAVNLESVPTKTIYTPTDANLFLLDQQLAFDAFMSTLTGAFHVLEPRTLTASCPDDHCWDTADETEVCDWLSGFTLASTPPAGTVRADRNARWHAFDVEVDGPGLFGTFDFTIAGQGNLLQIRGAENIASVAVRPESIGFDAQAPMTIEVSVGDSGTDRISLDGFTQAPMLVLREGVVMTADACGGGSAGPGWCYDPGEGRVTLTEDSGTLVHWTIVP